MYMYMCVALLSSLVDFKERNATVAQKWAELSDVERKQWGTKAEIVCSASIQVRVLKGNTIICYF